MLRGYELILIYLPTSPKKFKFTDENTKGVFFGRGSILFFFYPPLPFSKLLIRQLQAAAVVGEREGERRVKEQGFKHPHAPFFFSDRGRKKTMVRVRV